LWVDDAECGSRQFFATRITFGVEARPGQIPWIASLVYQDWRRDNVSLCGGALISKHHVITAAHCLGGQAGYQLKAVRLGVTSQRFTRGVSFDIAKVFSHPKFTENPVAQFDLAIIQLSEPVEYNAIIRPICLTAPLRSKPSRDLSGIQSRVAGWGRTENAFRSDILKYTTLQIISNKKCDTLYQRGLLEGKLGSLDSINILPSQLCARGGNSTDSCSGDSGGPLYAQDDEGIFRLLGVVSYGTNLCDSSLPGVYTRISEFLPWIHQVTSASL